MGIKIHTEKEITRNQTHNLAGVLPNKLQYRSIHPINVVDGKTFCFSTNF